MGLTTLALVRPHIDPFFYYICGARHRVKCDAFRSVTALALGPTHVATRDGGPVPDALSLLFPALVRFQALVLDVTEPAYKPSGKRTAHGDESNDVHAGVRSLDLGVATGIGVATLCKLPLRFPQLREFVAPAIDCSDALAATILGWRYTLTALDLSRVVRLDIAQLALLLVGSRVNGNGDGGDCDLGEALGLATLVRLRLASWHRPLEADLRRLLAQRVALSPAAEDNVGHHLGGRVEIEWVPAPEDERAFPLEFAGFA